MPRSKVDYALETARDALIGFIKEGRVLSGRKYAQDRLMVCARCEHLDVESCVCKICGCKMKAKVRIRYAKCPDTPRRW